VLLIHGAGVYAREADEADVAIHLALEAGVIELTAEIVLEPGLEVEFVGDRLFRLDPKARA
jgi:hypothetical protein